MAPDEIIAQLTRVQHRIPREALRAAGKQRDSIAPRLLASLAEVTARPEILSDDPDLQLPFYAMYLLAAWREPKAHALLLQFLRLPGEQSIELSGDIVTQDMNRMLAQTCAGDTQGIVSLACDRNVNEWARHAAISALAVLHAWGEIPRQAVLDHYRAFVTDFTPKDVTDEPDPALGEIVCCALDLQLTELREDLLACFDRGWIDESFVGREELVNELGANLPRREKKPIEEVAEAVGWWGCFASDPEPTARPARPELPPAFERAAPANDLSSREPRTPHRAPPKIGRNDPCPCGSGRKFKKCCGA